MLMQLDNCHGLYSWQKKWHQLKIHMYAHFELLILSDNTCKKHWFMIRSILESPIFSFLSLCFGNLVKPFFSSCRENEKQSSRRWNNLSGDIYYGNTWYERETSTPVRAGMIIHFWCLSFHRTFSVFSFLSTNPCTQWTREHSGALHFLKLTMTSYITQIASCI